MSRADIATPGLSLADVHFSESEGALQFEALGALAPVQAVAEITVEEGLLRIKLRDAPGPDGLSISVVGHDVLLTAGS